MKLPSSEGCVPCVRKQVPLVAMHVIRSRRNKHHHPVPSAPIPTLNDPVYNTISIFNPSIVNSFPRNPLPYSLLANLKWLSCSP
jgi:hypothetical protein